MIRMYRIFLVEDDKNLAELIENQLTGFGNDVRIVSNFRNVMEEFQEYDPHLVLMDIGLPYLNGFHWCEKIREISGVPVLFLSSASDNMNIVMAINMGGDDFIAKPVDPLVLSAKVKAILRRSYEIEGNPNIIDFEGARLNLNDGMLWVNGTSVELTRNEFRILRILLENKGRIVSRQDLMLALWQDDCYVEENTLTVNVGRLRKKLEEAGLRDVIVTKPGRGYRIS